VSLAELVQEIERRAPAKIQIRLDAKQSLCELTCGSDTIVELCGWLFRDLGYSFAGLIVEENNEWVLRYVFYGERNMGWIHILVRRTLSAKLFPSISEAVHAADWHEREAEDLFGLIFEGHPRLGDFVLHDDVWQEGIEPMRHKLDGRKPFPHRQPDLNWRPRRIVESPGAFAMPIGPVYSGLAESAHFLLETVGEDVIRAIPRLFYEYRGIEKIAEGRSVDDVLLLAERFSATTAFAHALGFCQAVEFVGGVELTQRARVLRVLLAELERFRHHVGAIEKICESTALAVAASQTAILEEELLRLCGALTGHRYLFGLLTPGGLTCELEQSACRDAVGSAQDILGRLLEVEQMLQLSSSFLDRLEEVGFISETDARNYGLVGPLARGSNVILDLRKAQPYSGYESYLFDVPSEREGDGYARLRVLFAESRQAVRIMEQTSEILTSGPVFTPFGIRPGAALGWVEAPRGAALHWVRIGDDGTVTRYRIMPPSFANWHGFHLAVEDFAFQDFPIILSTLDLSVAENDR
jgi:formate hydrogenlyase subunit 5